MLNVHPSIILICTSTKATTCLNKNITPSKGYLCVLKTIFGHVLTYKLELWKQQKLEKKCQEVMLCSLTKDRNMVVIWNPTKKNNHFPTVLNTWLSNILCDGSKFPRVEFCLYYQIELYAN